MTYPRPVCESLENRWLLSASVFQQVMASAVPIDVAPKGTVTIDAPETAGAYSFTARASGVVSVTMQEGGTRPLLRAWRGSAVAAASYTGAMQFYVTAGTTYHVQTQGGLSPGNVMVTVVSKATDDVGDDAAGSRLVVQGASGAFGAAGRMNYNGDVDMLRTVARKTGQMRLSITGPVSVEAQDASGNVLAVSSEGRLALDVLAGQTYFLRVYSDSGATGIYVLRGLPTLAADLAAATELLPPAGGQLPVADSLASGQTQAYRLTVPASGVITVTLAGWSGLDAKLALYNTDGTLLRVNDNAAAGTKDSKISFRAVEGTSYYVQAAGANNTAGEYELTVASTPIDDRGNTFETASPATLRQGASALSGRLNYDTDTDMFALTAMGNYRVEIAAAANKGYVAPDIAVYDSSGQVVALGADGTVDFLAAKGQKYYLAAYSDEGQTGLYRLNVKCSANAAPVLGALDEQVILEGETLLLQVTASDADGDMLTLSASDLPAGAEFDADTGVLAWTPTNQQAGSYTMTFVASDGALTGTGLLKVNVLDVVDAPANVAPVLAPAPSQTVEAGKTLRFTLSATDGDGDDVTYACSNLPAGATLDAKTGQFEWTPTTAGELSLVFTATDGADTSEPVSVAVTVTAAPTQNLAPVFEPIANVSTYVGQTTTFTVKAADPEGKPVTLGVSNLPSNATFNTATGAFSWTPAATRAGTWTTIRFTASDGVNTAEMPVVFTVAATAPAPVNTAPVLAAIPNQTIEVGKTLSFTLSATDAENNAITYACSNLPTGAVLDAQTGQFTWTPTAQQAGAVTLSFTASDSQATSQAQSAAITVTAAPAQDLAPVFEPIANVSTYVGQTTTFTVKAADPEGKPVTLGVSNLPSNATFNTATGAFSWTPAATRAGTWTTIRFSASDGVNTAEMPVVFTIAATAPAPAETAPVLAYIGDKSVQVGQTLTFALSATDPQGDALTYSATNLPAGATFNASTATFSWTPTAAGIATGVTFTVSDGKETDSETISISAVTSAPPPVGGSIGTTTAEGYAVIGEGKTNAFYIDRDGDGYGVGSPKGADADDTDASVNTTATALAKYGTIKAYANSKGYTPNRIYYIATNGNDSTGVVDDVSKPFASWQKVVSMLKPGDMAVFRGGTYREGIGAEYPALNGSASAWYYVMAYPGEKPVIDVTYNRLRVANSSYIVWDGLALTNSNGGLGEGVSMTNAHHIIFRNMNSYNNYRGMIAMQNLRDILVEYSIWHDNIGEHGIYIGSRDQANSNVTIRGNLFYRNSWNGFQSNGHVTNLLVEGNISHTNGMAGFSMLNGLNGSIIRNNLIYNNAKQGIVFSFYDSSYYTNTDLTQSNNQIINNTIWVGRYPYSGDATTTFNYGAIVFSDMTGGFNVKMDGNIIRNNVLVTYNGPTFLYVTSSGPRTSIVENNLIYRVGGTGTIISDNGSTMDWNQFQSLTSSYRNNVFGDPRFTNVSVDLYRQPEKYNFDLLTGSPAINLGLLTGAPTTDITGLTRTQSPDAGAYEG
jgi:hypothetical protein